MPRFLRLTLVPNGAPILVNPDNITCVMSPPKGEGAVIYFVSADDDKLRVEESLDAVEAMLGTDHA